MENTESDVEDPVVFYGEPVVIIECKVQRVQPQYAAVYIDKEPRYEEENDKSSI